MGIEYKKHPKNVLSIFNQFKQKNKTLISKRDFKTVLNELKVSFNDDQLTRIFEDNIETGGFMNFKDWLDKICAEYAENVE